MKSEKPAPTHRKRIGTAIKRRRKAIGESQERFAEMADCHRNYVGLVERGEQNLTVDSLVRIAKALNCKVSEILADAGL